MPERDLKQLQADDAALDAQRKSREIGFFSWLWKQLGLIWLVIRKSAKRVAVAIVGFALLVIGVALLVLPGPGWLIIIAGLAVLATEFVWAERLLDGAKRQAKRAAKTGGGFISRTWRKLRRK